MTDATTVGSDHLRRRLRLYSASSLAQVENNTESTRPIRTGRQGPQSGVAACRVSVVDDDLGLSAPTPVAVWLRPGTEIAMGRVGIVSAAGLTPRATMPTGTACSTSARSLER